MEPKSKPNIHCFVHVPHTHSLKVTVCRIFNNFMYEARFVLSTCEWNFHWWCLVSAQKVLDLGAVQVLDFQIRDSHPV